MHKRLRFDWIVLFTKMSKNPDSNIILEFQYRNTRILMNHINYIKSSIQSRKTPIKLIPTRRPTQTRNTERKKKIETKYNFFLASLGDEDLGFWSSLVKGSQYFFKIVRFRCHFSSFVLADSSAQTHTIHTQPMGFITCGGNSKSRTRVCCN